ncbi:type IA DNA topoisomerase [Paenibacillus silvae]|uniref:type IA DNA topoisomerase n=1 Tax=Paenibacillus silvae TaxID=1325358 RepID=UPI0020056231|nr:type IA DNA topoisomerase [Paenibacillus silvae]MCK6076845.1 DNA topoisomerase 3 [Paenibacillus silvae]MCK6152287.1 DNA topoisomerase 3 [Paenibacillus silvae]MCK6269648.1 DNA topoisomerase 3 [Paenibacillus silvae]
MKTLVIAEKPDMGRTIAAVIEPKAKNNRTYLEGEHYIITWAIGHLLGLAEPDAYDSKYKRWNIADLPIIPEQFKIVPNPRTKDQLKTIGELAKRASSIVNACDAGREGQYIFALIQQQLKLRQPVKRLWISDLTAESIRRGFDGLKDASEFENLTHAARARSEADWLIGMNASRAFTTRHNALLSVGRVQTPVLALIYDREIEIEAFQSQTFYEVAAWFRQEGVEYRGVRQGDKLTDAEAAEAIAVSVKGKTGHIAKYEAKQTKEYPYRLYDLTLLQREANAKYGYGAKKTLDIAQALYEKHKVISYPRTNSNYVTEQNIEGMHKTLQLLKNGTYSELALGAKPELVHKNNKGVCNPTKVEDHHAILPTLKRPGTLSKDEQNIYDLIVRRFLSHFYPPAEYKQHTVLTEVEKHEFQTSVKELLSLGWKVVLGSNDSEQGASGKKKSKKNSNEEEEAEEWTDKAFAVQPDLPVHCTKSEFKEKATQPPKSFTEGTLLKAMESAGKQIENEELRDAMKDSGLGTPATRAATIERLKNVGYITMQGKKMQLTLKGRTAIELIRRAGVDLLTSPEMTGQWERRLHQISKGEAGQDKFMENVKKFTLSIIEKVRVQTPAAANAFGEDTRGGKGRGKGTSARKSSAANNSTNRAGSRKASAANTSSSTQTAVRTSASPQSGVREVLASCPSPGCSGQIIEGKKGYGCSRFKEGCTFVIWKEYAGKKITSSMLKSLVEKGSTQVLSFKRKDGSTVKARIILKNAATGELSGEKQET